jgi:hypothetical protein
MSEEDLAIPPVCKCDNEEVSKVCKRPFYDAFDTCLICNHNKVCHDK